MEIVKKEDYRNSLQICLHFFPNILKNNKNEIAFYVGRNYHSYNWIIPPINTSLITWSKIKSHVHALRYLENRKIVVYIESQEYAFKADECIGFISTRHLIRKQR